MPSAKMNPPFRNALRRGRGQMAERAGRCCARDRIVTDQPNLQPARDEAPAEPHRERPGGPTQDELLDEALKETFPASDPTSVYRLE
jgi:hypothetical protein